MRNSRLYYLLCAALFSLAVAAGEPEAEGSEQRARLLRNVEGDDWSLPTGTRLTPGTGPGWIEPEWIRRWIVLYPVEQEDAIQSREYVFFNWADVNPQPGIYCWEKIDRQVERISGCRR